MGEAVEIGGGTIITAHTSITTNISIGRHVHVNLNCTIGHDTVIEDYVTLSPGVHLSGNVTITMSVYSAMVEGDLELSESERLVPGSLR